MVAEPETIARALGQLEGRITELSVSIQEVNRRMDAGLQEANRRMEAGLQEVNHRMDAGFQAIRQELQEFNHRMDARFQEVNHRIDRMLLALLAIGGGLVIAQTGLMATLIIRSG
jgi:predicted  nucleic acid-binding Zn-ribbon protein